MRVKTPRRWDWTFENQAVYRRRPPLASGRAATIAFLGNAGAVAEKAVTRWQGRSAWGVRIDNECCGVVEYDLYARRAGSSDAAIV